MAKNYQLRVQNLTHYFCLKDQLDHLRKLKIRAETINSKIGQTERKRIFMDLTAMRPETKLLYVTPEQAATDAFRVLIFELRISLVMRLQYNESYEENV